MKKAFPCIQTGNLQTPLDECGEAAEEWLTQFTWACTARRALNNLASHSKYKENVYYIEHDLFYPEQWPVPGWHRQCYSKSCHCIGKEVKRVTEIRHLSILTINVRTQFSNFDHFFNFW